MKKIAAILFLNLICIHTVMAMRDSRVTLSGGGDVAPTTTLTVSLNGLVPGAQYNVICYINIDYPFAYVRFGSTLSDNTSSIASYNLNGTPLTQGQLNVGQNLAVIDGYFTSPATSSVNFTNLDQNNSFNVNGCYAIPTVG